MRSKILLINKRESVGLKYCNDQKGFIEYTNDIGSFYENIDDVIADVLSDKKHQPIVRKLFIRGRKLNILLVLITQSYFAVPKSVRLSSTDYFIMNIPSKPELQQIAINHLSDIYFKDFMKLYNQCAAKPYSFLANDTSFASDSFLSFKPNLLETI